MDSVRTWLKLWAGFTAITLLYAFVDLGANPWLRSETNFTMQPDVTQTPDLLHWGGRLLKEGAVGLLICNAIVVSGVVALGVNALINLVSRRLATPSREERVSLTTIQEVEVHPSIPPPA